MIAVGKHVTTETDLDTLLQLVADSAREVIEAQTLVVPIIDFERGEYIYHSASGLNAEVIAGQSFPLNIGMCGWVLSNQAPLLFGHGSDLPMGNKTAWEEGMESALLVPMISRGKIIGGLSGLGKTGGRSFSNRDLEMLSLFANQASVAVENAQILKQLTRQQDELEDVLENTRYEKQLAEVTLETIAEGVIVTSISGQILKLNSAAEALLDVALDEVSRQPVEQILPINIGNPGEHRHPVHAALENDRMTLIPSTEITTANRKTFHLEGSVSVIPDVDGLAIGTILLFRDVTVHHKMVEQIHHYATYDQLTSLINRREFETRLQNTLDNAIKQHQCHALCYFDLDQFKIVNDSCGHAAGDELLSQLSQLLCRRVRDRDTLSRIGGDEFGLLLENCPLENALKIAESLRLDVENFRFDWQGKVFRIGVSIGLVMITDESISVDDLLSAADQACYAAKEQGRNRIKVYTESDQQLLLRSSEMKWVTRLQDALANDHFVLFYQPIVSTRDTSPFDKSSYYEILLRLRDSDDDTLPPGSFMPAAERYGVMASIDRWVIQNYFQWLNQNPQHVVALQRCSINLSGQSLGDESLLGFISEQINEYKIPAEKLCFEITETAAISNFPDALRFITEMRKLKVQFSLDDFGTGLSSFGYIKELPVDNIKIDGAFIKNILTDKIDSALVSAIVDIGRTMKKGTIAEFVESMDVFEYIRELGVDYAQGYGIARPESLISLIPKP